MAKYGENWPLLSCRKVISYWLLKQEHSYRQQIARQLRTQFAEGISVTLKPTLKVTGNRTNGQIIHDLLLDELLDVEYYRDLEMWVRGHSSSFKLVPFDSLDGVSYSPSTVTMVVYILTVFDHYCTNRHMSIKTVPTVYQSSKTVKRQ